MGEFSITHWLVIAVVGIIFFGPKRLPQLGQSLGESIRGFKKAMSGDDDKAVAPKPQQQAQQSQPEHISPEQLPLTHSAPTDPVQTAQVVYEDDTTRRKN